MGDRGPVPRAHAGGAAPGRVGRGRGDVGGGPRPTPHRGLIDRVRAPRRTAGEVPPGVSAGTWRSPGPSHGAGRMRGLVTGVPTSPSSRSGDGVCTGPLLPASASCPRHSPVIERGWSRVAQTTETYGAKDITVLEGLEAVRKRPGMYIGSTGVGGSAPPRLRGRRQLRRRGHGRPLRPASTSPCCADGGCRGRRQRPRHPGRLHARPQDEGQARRRGRAHRAPRRRQVRRRRLQGVRRPPRRRRLGRQRAVVRVSRSRSTATATATA